MKSIKDKRNKLDQFNFRIESLQFCPTQDKTKKIKPVNLSILSRHCSTQKEIILTNNFFLKHFKT